MGLVVVSPDGCLLERAVHSLDLTVSPRMIGLGQAMLDAVSQAGPVEGMAAPACSGAITILRQVGELDTVVGQYSVDPERDGRHQFFEEGPGCCTRGLLHQPGEGVFGGPVHRHEEIEFAFLGADLSDIDVEVANGVALEGLPGGLVAGDLG